MMLNASGAGRGGAGLVWHVVQSTVGGTRKSGTLQLGRSGDLEVPLRAEWSRVEPSGAEWSRRLINKVIPFLAYLPESEGRGALLKQQPPINSSCYPADHMPESTAKAAR